VEAIAVGVELTGRIVTSAALLFAADAATDHVPDNTRRRPIGLSGALACTCIRAS